MPCSGNRLASQTGFQAIVGDATAHIGDGKTGSGSGASARAETGERPAPRRCSGSPWRWPSWGCCCTGPRAQDCTAFAEVS